MPRQLPSIVSATLTSTYRPIGTQAAKKTTWLIPEIEDPDGEKTGENNSDICNQQEIHALQARLRDVGVERFLAETIHSGVVPIRKLCTAFNVPLPTNRPSEDQQHQPVKHVKPNAAIHSSKSTSSATPEDDHLLPPLTRALRHHLTKRARLTAYNTVQDVISLLHNAKNIIVLSGAGVSTSLGIPDFRSPGEGLYAQLGDLGLSDVQEAFSLEMFEEEPEVFFRACRLLLPEVVERDVDCDLLPILDGRDDDQDRRDCKNRVDAIAHQDADDEDEINISTHKTRKTEQSSSLNVQTNNYTTLPRHISPTHAFIKLLQDTNRLLCNYTQNIDGLELAAGISPHKLVQCHGSFALATCRRCGVEVPGEEIFPEIRKGHISRCRVCPAILPTSPRAKKMNAAKATNLKRKAAGKGKRRAKKRRYDEYSDTASDSSSPNASESGILKPNIVLFGEALPVAFHTNLASHLAQADLLLVLGTSMLVAPVSSITRLLPASVPQVLISRESVGRVGFDVELLGECDVVCGVLARGLGLLAGGSESDRMVQRCDRMMNGTRLGGERVEVLATEVAWRHKFVVKDTAPARRGIQLAMQQNNNVEAQLRNENPVDSK